MWCCVVCTDLFFKKSDHGFCLQPPKIKAFVDKVIQSPLQDIAIPLSGFRWEYSKVKAFFCCSTKITCSPLFYYISYLLL